MKKIFLFLSIAFFLTSCGEYQEVLKSSDIALKFSTAEKLYNEAKEEDSRRKFRKALRLFEQLMPEYRGKPQGQKLAYLFADTYYELNDYYLASYQFERFTETYPESEKLEEAAYKGAKSYYFLSPPYNLDQTETLQGISKLQAFINRFPKSEYMEEANKLAEELRIKLERKAYEIAKQYHHTENYIAAITAFDNFILEYPGSPFREQAYYYKFESAYLYAINSYTYAMPERLAAARDYYEDYQRYYPEGEFIGLADNALKDIELREQQFKI